MPHPEHSQPDHWTGLNGPRFNRQTIKLDASKIPADNQNARAQLIIDALPIVHRGEWRLLSRSSKELLASTGLIARPPGSWRYFPTSECIHFESLVDRLPKDGKLLATHALLLLTDRFGSKAAEPTAMHLELLEIWFEEHSTAPDNATIGAYRKLVLALQEERNLNLSAFQGKSVDEVLNRRLSRVKVDSQLLTYLTTKDPEEMKRASAYLYNEGAHNDLPFLSGDRFKEARREVKDKAVATATRSFKYAFNFDRLSGETRRAGLREECLIAKFGLDCFEDCRAVFGSSIERTPGRGYYLSNPRAEKLFSPELVADGSYAQSYHHYGRALDQFPDTTYLFLRGAIVVYNPSLMYRLPVGPKLPSQRREHYALFLANDHFSGGHELAALLPIKVLQQHLMPCLQELTPAPEDPLPKDISMPGFNLETLVQACNRAGLPPIMLANISTVFAGNVAGYPKRSEPFYTWEPEREKAGSEWEDALGRIHYAWYVRERSDSSNKKTRTEQNIEKLRPLGEACHEVADVAKGLLDLLDLFTARYDAWKCDLVPSESLSPRMLVEAYTWHTTLRERNAPTDAFPLVCVAHRYDWTKPPQVVLDTQTLEIVLDNGQRWALPPKTRGAGPVELSAWMKHVMPKIADRIGEGGFAERETTLVLLPREYAHSLQSDVPLPKM
jgi:hypothetical protein